MNTRERLLKKLYANYQYWQKRLDKWDASKNDLQDLSFYQKQSNRYNEKFERLLFEKCH